MSDEHFCHFLAHHRRSISVGAIFQKYFPLCPPPHIKNPKKCPVYNTFECSVKSDCMHTLVANRRHSDAAVFDAHVLWYDLSSQSTFPLRIANTILFRSNFASCCEKFGFCPTPRQSANKHMKTPQSDLHQI